MNRLEKKCVLVSTGLHLLLVGILFVGPAFLSSKTTAEALPPIDFIPWKTVDAMVTGGGNPKATSTTPPAPAPAPTPAPPVTQPAPTPPPVEKTVAPPVMVSTPPPAPKRVQEKPAPEPEPEKPPKIDPPKSKEPDPEAVEAKPEPKPRRPQISTELVTRKSSDKSKEAKARAEERARELAREQARAEARQVAEARQRIMEKFGQAVEQIGSGLSSGTMVELKGPGGGGVPYANFLQAVQSAYDKAWILPNGVTDNEATAVVTVTIARDGRVVFSRIERPSGNRQVDRSVQAALDKVRYAAPLPDDARENERTVTINFNVRAKRGLA